MPLFNTERYLGEAIEGVLNQTHRNLELIICDNGSTDRSFEIAERYSRGDSRIRLVRNQRNVGYAGNLHKVLSLARGDFLIVHCADDLSDPSGIEQLMRLATGPEVDPDRVLVLADSYVTDGSGHPMGVHVQRAAGFDTAFEPFASYVGAGEVRRFRGKEALGYALPRLTIVGWLGASLFSRKLFDSIEGVYNGLLYSPDQQMNYHLLSRDPDVLWLRKPLFSWRLHEGGQIGLARADAVPKAAWDGYSYTFHFSRELLDDIGVKREQIIHTFIDSLCLRKALAELKAGNTLFAFRHLCLGFATYPGVTLRNGKAWVVMAGILTGPLGQLLARMGYALGIWRRPQPGSKQPNDAANSHPVALTQ